MSSAFSVYSTGGPHLDIEESEITGHVKLAIVGENSKTYITVDGSDLARALISASPSFTRGVGEVAQRAILSVLGRHDE